MNPQQAKDRMRAIQQMSKGLVAAVYKQQKENQLKKMGELALKNQRIRNTSAACFMFEGEWFTYPHEYEMPRVTKGIPRSIDHTLLAEATEIMDPGSFEMIETRVRITDYINMVLTTCRQVNCVWDILPGALHTQYSLVTTGAFNIGLVLSEEEKESINERGAKGIAALRVLYMTELLLAKT